MSKKTHLKWSSFYTYCGIRDIHNKLSSVKRTWRDKPYPEVTCKTCIKSYLRCYKDNERRARLDYEYEKKKLDRAIARFSSDPEIIRTRRCYRG